MIIRRILCLFFLFSSFSGYAQLSDSLDIQSYYQEMLDGAQTFKQYKVIKKVDLTLFERILGDTLKSSASEIRTHASRVSTLESELETKKTQITELQSNLETSESLNSNINFLGMELSKSGYNIFVWTFILLLIAGVVILLLTMQSNRKNVNNAKKDLEASIHELKEFKTNSFQKETKLRRDLQTALNKLEEGKTRF